MLSERTKPSSVSGMVGNERARLDLVKWLKNWKIGSKPVLLTGPPGVGKSTSVYLVAKQFRYTVIEYNASDVRTRERLREALAPTLENTSLFGGEKLMVFLDEIDGLLGRADYAGMDYVLDFVENTTVPLAMAANLEETEKIKKIEQKSLVLRFRAVGADLLVLYLRGICARERLAVPESILRRIAESSRGDVRQALNSLQTVSGEKIIGATTDHQFVSDSSALDSILQAEDLRDALSLLREFGSQPRDKIRAIFDSVVTAKNLSIESKSESLDLIAIADLLLGKINQSQSWRLLRYLDRYLALSTMGKKIAGTDSGIPWNLKLAIWNDGRVIKSMSLVLSEEFHVSKSDFANFYLPYLALYFKNRPGALELFLKKNEFEESERRVILKLSSKW
jgi:replication factor C large subunit